MATRIASLTAIVGADTAGYHRAMDGVKNSLGGLSGIIQGIGNSARVMTLAFSAPLAGLAVGAVNAASGFDAAMRNINSIMQMSESQFASFEDTVFSYAKTTRDGVVPATEALYEIFSAGITDQAKAMAVWKTSTMVAEAGLADLEQTTNAMTATMSAYNLETSEAGRVGNVWTQMVKQGVGSLGDFLSNSQKILPLSAAMNISLEDMGATLAFLSQGGGGAAKAETAYAMMLSNMLKPTEAMTEALHKLGVQSGTQLIAKFGSVSNAVMALRKEVGDVDFNKMFSKTGLEAALRITGNIDAMKNSIVEFNKGLDTATLDAWTQQSQSFAYQWDRLKASINAVAIVVGQAIMPLVTPLMNGISGILQKITEVNPHAIQLGVIFLGVAAAIPPIIWGLTLLLNPFALLIAGAVALGTAIVTNFNNIQTTIRTAVQSVVGDLKPVEDAFKKFYDTLFPKVEEIPNSGTPIVVDATSRITVTKPMSLWEIYEKQGYKDKFSWKEFMKEAKAGGWKGGVVNLGDEITISGGDTLGAGQGSKFRDSFENQIHDMMGGSGGGGKKEFSNITIFDRLNAAIKAAWPTLEASLNTMWANFKTWVSGTALPAVDTAGSDILNHMSTWFDTSNSDFSGATGVYEAISGGLTTDVGKAAQNAGGVFQSAFPKMTAGLKNLFDSVGKWIEAEAIPTLARSIGFVAGRLASLLGQAISGVWDTITGKDGGGGTKGAADALNTMVAQPLNAGIQQGLNAGVDASKGEMLSPIDTLFGNISSAILLAAGAWVIAPNIVSAVAAPIIGLVTSAFSTAMAASGTTGAVTALIKTIGTGLATGFAAFSVLGLGALLIAALLSNEDIQKGLSAWSGVWESFKKILVIAVEDIKADFLEIRRNFERTLNDITFNINAAKLLINPSDTGAEQAARTAGNNMLGSDVATGFEKGIQDYLAGNPLNVPANSVTVGTNSGEVFNKEAMDSFIRNVTNPLALHRAVNEALLRGDQSALQVLLPITTAYDFTTGAGGSDNIVLKYAQDTGMTPEKVGQILMEYYKNDPIMLSQIEANLQSIKVNASKSGKIGVSWGDGATDGGDWISRAVKNSTGSTDTTATVTLPVDTKPVMTGVDDAMKTWANGVATGLPTAVQTAVTANAGNMNAAADSMTKPFIDAFTTAFAPETGTVTAVWTTFLTGFVTDVTTLQTTVDTTMPKVQAAVVTAVDTMKDSVLELNKQLEESANRLNALVTGSPYKITVEIETKGSMPTTPAGSVGVNGSHADGLMNVPFDGYIAELHQGERVLTKNEAKDYSSRNAVPKSNSGSGSIDNSTNTINVSTVASFDEFKREAERRGYRLERYKR